MRVTMTQDEARRLADYARTLARLDRERDTVLARRDALITRARQRGVTLPALAAATGLSVPRVEQIIYGRRDR